MVSGGEWKLFSSIGTAYHRYDYGDINGAFEKWGNTSELSYEDCMNLQLGHMTIKAQVNHAAVGTLINNEKSRVRTEG